jgi:hypothetical protein
VRHQLSKKDTERLFVGAVDQSLPDIEAHALEEVLHHDAALKAQFETYQRTVTRLRKMPQVKAPASLASLILRRTRRRRFQLRSRDFHHFRFPMEVVVPMLIAALVALFMLLAAP